MIFRARIKAFPLPEDSTFVWSGIMVKRFEKREKSNFVEKRVIVKYYLLQSGEWLNFSWHFKIWLFFTFLVKKSFSRSECKGCLHSKFNKKVSLFFSSTTLWRFMCVWVFFACVCVCLPENEKGWDTYVCERERKFAYNKICRQRRPLGPQIYGVVDRWSLLRGSFCKQVLGIRRWSLSQVWLYLCACVYLCECVRVWVCVRVRVCVEGFVVKASNKV
jgi:hypothetical protein